MTSLFRRPKGPTDWVISDTHFGHTKMQFTCCRPVGFEDLIFKNVCDSLLPGDILYHLGDVSFGGDMDWARAFTDVCRKRGTKAILIRGNHDHGNEAKYYKQGWEFVAQSIVLKKYGFRILLSHRPARVLTHPNMVNIHGHLHDTNPLPEVCGPRHALIKMEHEYRPFLMAEVLATLSKQISGTHTGATNTNQ